MVQMGHYFIIRLYVSWEPCLSRDIHGKSVKTLIIVALSAFNFTSGVGHNHLEHKVLGKSCEVKAGSVNGLILEVDFIHEARRVDRLSAVLLIQSITVCLIRAVVVSR